MKKIIGIFGVAVMAMAMFFNTNSINNSNGDFNLASIGSMNTANAEISCQTTPNILNWYVFYVPEWGTNACKKPGEACCI